MKIKDLTDWLETIAPPSLQESYDNSGLLVGNPNTEVKKALVTLDVTEEILAEAIDAKCQLVIAHHPIIFGDLKRLNGKNYVERVVIKAIKHDIAIYAIHTNLDNVQQGVNAMICEKLQLQNPKILAPKEGLLKKLVTFIPVKDFDKVTEAVFKAGGGHIGNYSHTGFDIEGTGTFKGNEQSKPAIGKANQLEKVNEKRWETIFPSYLQSQVINALISSHPYEEVAYDIYPLSNTHQLVGSGMTGTLKQPVDAKNFLKKVKKQLQTDCIRYTPLTGKPVQKVAVCGGSGRFLLNNAIAAGADVFITADFKYHDFFDADGRIVVADVGHYESEQFTKDLLHRKILEKFPKFAAQISKKSTNPINYL